MTDVSATMLALDDYVALAIQRRRRALSSEDRVRIEAIEQLLRDAIDGARLAPRKIEGRPVEAAASAPVRPATATPAKAPKGGGQSISELVDKLDLSPGDQAKLRREVKLEALPKSRYTPTRSPTFLDDYYSTDIVLTGDIAWAAPPKAVKRADGEGDVELSSEARVLLGLERPGAARPNAGARPGMAGMAALTGNAAAAGPAAAAAAIPAPAAPRERAQPARGRPAIVHLRSGSVLRGQIDLFDPASGTIELLGETTSGEDTPLAVDEVLAVFFGLFRGEEPSLPPQGQRVAVRLVNDRQVAGLTDDYREGADAITVVPEQKRGNVHHVWVPASAVKEIHLT